MTRGFKRIGLILALILCALTVASAFAAENAPARTLKVGYLGYEGFIAPNEKGEFQGYGVDYLNEIAKYAGFSYEYVYCTWADSLEMLKTHEIDLVCTAKFTAERAMMYDYSAQSFGQVQGVLYTRPDNPDIYYEDYVGLNGKTIGFMDGSLNISIFADYAEANGFSYTAEIFPGDADMARALWEGKLDAMVTEQLAVHDDLLTVATYSSNPYYLMGWQGNDFMAKIDAAMNKIRSGNPYYELELYKKWYGSTGYSTSLHLTRQEAEYIESCPPLRVAQLRSRNPLSFYDEKTGELLGMNEDFLALISEKTGLTFESEALGASERPIDVITGTDRFDLAMGVVDNVKFRQNSAILLTDPFLVSNMAVVAPKGFQYDPSADYTVAVKDSFVALMNYLELNYPNFTIMKFVTPSECREAVQKGLADITIDNIFVSNYVLQQPKNADLQVLPTSFFEEDNCFMAAADIDPLLISILNKAISSFTDEEINRIILANTTAKPYQMTPSDLLYEYRGPIAVIGILLLICFALLGMLMLVKQRNLRMVTHKNTQLAEAVMQAEQANAAKSQFLSRMSHEIRTPMNAIVGITSIAKKHKDNPQAVEEYLDKVDASSKVLLNIINDVLDMSAIEGGKLRIAHEEFDMKTVLNGISAMYYTQCRQREITFSMAVNLTDEMLIGDALRVSQILLNLVSNACKFTSSGGSISITVTETEHRNNQVFIRFTVEDTGSGMSEDMLSRLFKPFEQEDATTAQKHGGSGLGLSIVKNLVDMMHGAIKVDSAPGRGTTFTVDIPFTLTGHRSDTSPEKLKNIRALVVDDERHAREYTAIVLDRIGLQYDVASSGAEALSKVVSEHEKGRGYDICFIDWKMPDMSGIEVTKKMRAVYDKDTIIVIISAYDLSEVQEEAIAAGANQFISKPLFQSTVFNLLLQLSGSNFIRDTAVSDDFDFTGHKVLLAEDNALNAEIAMELLGIVHMQADHAENGKEAAEMFERSEAGTYDAILMDIQMPVMNGYEATAAIRKSGHPQAKAIPIYAMTANAFTEDVSAALSAGMNGHIAKPIDTEVLYSTLKKAVGRRASDGKALR